MAHPPAQAAAAHPAREISRRNHLRRGTFGGEELRSVETTSSRSRPIPPTPDGMERFPMSHRTGMSRGVLLLALLCAVSFGAIVRVALAGDNDHVACVEHGFYSGDNNNDASFFARVYQGCSSTHRCCAPHHRDGVGCSASSDDYNSTGTCNTWSRRLRQHQRVQRRARTLSDPTAFLHAPARLDGVLSDAPALEVPGGARRADPARRGRRLGGDGHDRPRTRPPGPAALEPDGSGASIAATARRPGRGRRARRRRRAGRCASTAREAGLTCPDVEPHGRRRLRPRRRRRLVPPAGARRRRASAST